MVVLPFRYPNPNPLLHPSHPIWISHFHLHCFFSDCCFPCSRQVTSYQICLSTTSLSIHCPRIFSLAFPIHRSCMQPFWVQFTGFALPEGCHSFALPLPPPMEHPDQNPDSPEDARLAALCTRLGRSKFNQSSSFPKYYAESLASRSCWYCTTWSRLICCEVSNWTRKTENSRYWALALWKSPRHSQALDT